MEQHTVERRSYTDILLRTTQQWSTRDNILLNTVRTRQTYLHTEQWSTRNNKLLNARRTQTYGYVLQSNGPHGTTNC